MADETYSDENVLVSGPNEIWAVVHLMGHEVTAGLIRPSDLGGLLRVDVPIGDGWRTRYFGANAIFNIDVVSEEIARAYITPDREIAPFEIPIVTRAEHERFVRESRLREVNLKAELSELQRRLTAVNGDMLVAVKYTNDQEADQAMVDRVMGKIRGYEGNLDTLLPVVGLGDLGVGWVATLLDDHGYWICRKCNTWQKVDSDGFCGVHKPGERE